MTTETKRTILFMGDSIVAGFPFRRTQSFPSIIEKALNENGQPVAIYNEGSNGQTAAQLVRLFKREVARLKPDQVIIMTGSNDVMDADVSAEQIAEMILGMAEDARSLGSEPVLLTSLFYDSKVARVRWARGVDYDAANETIAELNDILLKSPYKVIDVAAKYTQFAEYYDGVHPTPAGYRLIAKTILASNQIL